MSMSAIDTEGCDSSPAPYDFVPFPSCCVCYGGTCISGDGKPFAMRLGVCERKSVEAPKANVCDWHGIMGN